jgi:hypothetical protein
MKSKLNKITFLTLILYNLLMLVGCASNPYQQDQIKLAHEIGVKIEDFPSPKAFPVGYYFTILQPGMTLDEVHKTIQGYEVVKNCRNTTEIYYYFSTNDEKALRFEVFYGIDKFRFESLQGEDKNSKTIRTEGCLPGVIKGP